MKLWEVQVVIPPSGKERKGWTHMFVALAEHVDEAMKLVREENQWVFAGALGARMFVTPYEGKTVSQGRTGRCSW